MRKGSLASSVSTVEAHMHPVLAAPLEVGQEAVGLKLQQRVLAVLIRVRELDVVNLLLGRFHGVWSNVVPVDDHTRSGWGVTRR